MDGQKSPAKPTRTHLSILQSSPTMRSSTQSLFSPTGTLPDQETQDLEEQKPHKKHSISPVQSNATLVFSALLLSVYTLFAFFVWDDISTSENILLSLIFIAGLLIFISKNKCVINITSGLCKQISGISCFASKSRTKKVQWFIGEDKTGFENIVREGVECYSNGDVYEGEYQNGRCNGSGVYNYIVNGRYEGDWVDGRCDGYGIESWVRGSRYIGQYRQGLRHGYGVYMFYTGDSYGGEWCNGQSHGVGMQSCGDGSCYVGEFKCGVKHGIGSYHFRNGDRYCGEYFGDKIHGFGVYHFSNGHCYEGSWHEGQKQGYGVYTFRNGETRCGEWNGGKLKTPLSPLAVSILRAVQAAREKAENALHHRGVDEEVKEAVTVANKAAMAARVAAVKAVQNRIHGQSCNIND